MSPDRSNPDGKLLRMQRGPAASRPVRSMAPPTRLETRSPASREFQCCKAPSPGRPTGKTHRGVTFFTMGPEEQQNVLLFPSCVPSIPSVISATAQPPRISKWEAGACSGCAARTVLRTTLRRQCATRCWFVGYPSMHAQ